jgi:hypothetical protein
MAFARGYFRVALQRFQLIPVPQAVPASAEFAEGGGLSVIHPVLDRFESAKVREHRLQIIIR